jgi:hypothetical protein
VPVIGRGVYFTPRRGGMGSGGEDEASDVSRDGQLHVSSIHTRNVSGVKDGIGILFAVDLVDLAGLLKLTILRHIAMLTLQ